MLPKSTEVLIVGAGPTGLALAITLAQSGVRPLVVEREQTLQTTSRAAVIHAHTLEVLDRIGVTRAMVAEGRRIENFAFRDRDRLLGNIRFDRLPSTHRYLLMLPQHRTEALLLDRLAELGGEVRRGVSFLGYREERGIVHADLMTAEGKVEVSTRFLVAADGIHSAVREAAGIPFDGAAYDGSFVLADVRFEGAAQRDEVSLFFSPEGLVVVAPLPDGTCRIVATADEAPEKPDAAFIQGLLNRRGPKAQSIGRVSDVGWSSRFRLHHRLARRYRNGPVFLIGDAAHAHSPAGGQGMNTGLVDACTLGRLMSDVVRGTASERKLGEYEVLRRPAAASVLKLAGRLTTAATLRSPWKRRLRNLALALASRIPAFRRRIALNLAGLSRRAATLP
jgi:2-polyprenyl-6-methoxyphenol hydroxylase-like FAD-dependent oxidoreductase